MGTRTIINMQICAMLFLGAFACKYAMKDNAFAYYGVIALASINLAVINLLFDNVLNQKNK